MQETSGADKNKSSKDSLNRIENQSLGKKSSTSFKGKKPKTSSGNEAQEILNVRRPLPMKKRPATEGTKIAEKKARTSFPLAIKSKVIF